MKTSTRIALLPIFCLLFFHSQAQKFFESGYIIKAISQDTIRGLVEHRSWTSNPRTISFKAEGGTIQRLGLADLNEFAIISTQTNKVYRKRILDIDKGKFDVGDLKNYPEPLISRDTVFAELYESGKTNLYYLKDENLRIHYLVEKNDTGIQDLRIERYIDALSQTIRSNDIYKNQLIKLMSDCGGIIVKISELSFKESDLRKLLVFYNNCSGGGTPKTQYSQKKERTDIFIGALLGGGFRTEKISDVSNYPLSGFSFGPSLNLDAAIVLGVILPHTKKHLELGFELGWGYFHESKKASLNTGSGRSDLDVVLAAHMLKGNILLRGVIPIKKIQLTLSTGLSMGGILTSVNRVQETDYVFGTPSQTTQEAIPMGDWQAALIVAAGIRVKSFNIEMRYFLNSSLSNGIYIKTFPNSFNLTVYYNFYRSDKKPK
jgi:hypothetical protein